MANLREGLTRRNFFRVGAGTLGFLALSRRVEAGGGPSDIRPFIIDDVGREVEIPTEVFTKVVHNPRFAFGFDLIRDGYLQGVTHRIDEVRGFAVKGRPEMLNRSPVVLAEDNPQNQIPLEVNLEDRRLLIKAKVPEGFPAGSQVSVILPISPDPRLRYVMRTFTEETETKEKTIKTPAIMGVIYLESGVNDFFWDGRFTDLYPQYLGEPGIEGMTVQLRRKADPKDFIGELIAETATNEHGVYVFADVKPGRYRVSPRLFSGQARTQGNSEVIVNPETQVAFGVLVGIKPEDLPANLVPRPHKNLLPRIP